MILYSLCIVAVAYALYRSWDVFCFLFGCVDQILQDRHFKKLHEQHLADLANKLEMYRKEKIEDLAA